MIVDIKQAIDLLKKGCVIGIPTDTVYGFAALEEFSDKIYDLKKRPREKKLISMIHSIDQLKQVDEILKKEMLKKWPGQTTFIYEVDGEMKSYRIPDEPNLLMLLKELNLAIVTTSANLSGKSAIVRKNDFILTFPEVPLLKETIKSSKTATPSEIIVYNKTMFKKIR